MSVRLAEAGCPSVRATVITLVTSLEAGHSVGTENLVRIMRALGRLQAFEAFIPVPEVSPYDVERLRGKTRRRASRGGREW